MTYRPIRVLEWIPYEWGTPMPEPLVADLPAKCHIHDGQTVGPRHGHWGIGRGEGMARARELGITDWKTIMDYEVGHYSYLMCPVCKMTVEHYITKGMNGCIADYEELVNKWNEANE